MIHQPRRLSQEEIEALLARDLVASLASIDEDGFPHVTPIWFLWAEGAFWMTSFADRPHLRRLTRNPRAGVTVDTEAPEQSDGERPNQQVRAVGSVILEPDHGYTWTRRIQDKYQRTTPTSSPTPNSPARTVICLRPRQLVPVASV
jgi:hypothetical protein